MLQARAACKLLPRSAVLTDFPDQPGYLSGTTTQSLAQRQISSKLAVKPSYLLHFNAIIETFTYVGVCDIHSMVSVCLLFTGNQGCCTVLMAYWQRPCLPKLSCTER